MRKVIIITDMKQVREPYISTTPENKEDIVLGPVPYLGCRVTSIKAYLLTDEPVNNLEKVEEGKYLIKELTIDEYLNHSNKAGLCCLHLHRRRDTRTKHSTKKSNRRIN